MKRLLAALKGIITGYILYLPIMLIIEYATHRRIDTEKTFYALYYPLGAPFLLTKAGWRFIHFDQVVLTILGGLFLSLGIAYALRNNSV